MRFEITTWDAIVMTGITVIVAYWIVRLRGFVNNGEIYALYSASGDGMVGRVNRSEQPILFWLVVALHGAILLGFWIGGLLTLFRLY